MVDESRSGCDPRSDSAAASVAVEAVRANQLIDELFEEFEATLAQPGQPSSRVSSALQAFRQSEVRSDYLELTESVASLVAPLEATLVPYTSVAEPLRSRQLTDPGMLAQPDALAEKTLSAGDRWLITLASSSLLIALSLWVVSQWQPTQAPIATVGPVAPVPAVNPADQAFADYMLRSLQGIQPQPTQAPPQTPAVAMLPPVSQTQPTPTVNPVITERVYIPVYQPAAPPVVIAAPPQPAPSPVAIAPQPAAKPAPQTAPPLTVAAKPQQTLVGVLELGDRSVALLSMNGATRRVQVGEPVDTTGWKLVEIVNQKAVVQRNGEIRSIYVGQQF